LLYIIKHEDGTVASKEVEEVDDLQAEEQREFGTLVKSLIGLSSKDIDHIDAEEVSKAIGSAEVEFGLSESEIQEVADQIPNGSSAIFVIFEHTWARGLRAAIQQAGGYTRAQGLINPDTLQKATNELAIVLEAINKAESESMEKMATTLSGAKAQEEEARSKASEILKFVVDHIDQTDLRASFVNLKAVRSVYEP
jgi:multidrug resistance efflux pump